MCSYNLYFFVFFLSCETGKLATNELPLHAASMENPSDSATTTFTNPLAISEDAELDTTVSTTNLRNYRSPDDKK